MMHMQFDKNTVQCLRCVLHEVKDHEETQELRLEDGMPDIGEILGCWGQAFLRGKEWRPGGISVNGGINAWVLYKSEDEGEICSVETCIPYQFKCEFSENEIDGGISIQPFLRSMDARMISSRKIMLRGDMSVLCEAMVDSQIHCSTPPSMPEDVMVLEETFEPLLPKEMNEKAFMVDDAVSFPHSVDRINKIIYYQLCPYVTDYKLMTDKIIFRGQSRLHALYMDTEGQLHTWDEEFPFSQFAELGREYADGAIARIVMATTSTTLEKDDGNFRLRAGITGQFLIFDHDKITIVKDAYSPNRTVNVTTEELLIPGVLDVQQPSVTAECKLSNDVNDVVDSILCTAHP